MRIAQLVGPFEAVPPERYGGTERVVATLVDELVARGHEVVTYAPGDSRVAGELIPTVDAALRPSGFEGDASGYTLETALRALEDADGYDLIHSHLEWLGIFLGQATRTPVVHTFHGRLDYPWAGRLLGAARADLVAISASQASAQPDVGWAGIVHNGLHLERQPWRSEPGEDLCFVGRLTPEKGVLDAIEVAERTGRHLRIAAKVGPTPPEQAYFEETVRPALEAAHVEFLGELDDEERGRLVSESYASLVTGVWPEPFGLVVIESLAAGTPVLGRRVGALPEIMREGVDGFFGDDVGHLAFLVDRVGELDRTAIRQGVIGRFSGQRMADAYEAIYEEAVARRAGDRS